MDARPSEHNGQVGTVRVLVSIAAKRAFLMRQSARFLCVFLLSCSIPSLARADDFTIDLNTQAGKKTEKAEAKYPAPDMKQTPRAVLLTAVDTPITVKWTVRNGDKAATAKDVLVHFFVVKIDKADQPEVPKLTKNVVVESALTMDFKAKDKSDAEISFTVPNPGRFLLRLELKNAGAKDGREPFAAMELLVK